MKSTVVTDEDFDMALRTHPVIRDIVTSSNVIHHVDNSPSTTHFRVGISFFDSVFWCFPAGFACCLAIKDSRLQQIERTGGVHFKLSTLYDVNNI